MHPLPAPLVDRVLDLLQARRAATGRTAVLAVDGPSGSGKSTLAGALAVALGGRLEERPDAARQRLPVVAMDDLYPGWDGLEDAVPRLLEWVLEPLTAGRPARYRRYDWVAGRYAEHHRVPDAPALLVEGVASASSRCATHLAGAIWVEAPRELRMARGLARDGETYAPHWQHWAGRETLHFTAERTRERSDLRVDTAASGRWLLTR